ncbi:metallophosphoesterase [Carnobacterium gallinarum]|uniref:metallophosphoesterase n=1 Tax=Carnobacterium gallinarum TaxID=2749 RepID=UPI003CCC2D8D
MKRKWQIVSLFFMLLFLASCGAGNEAKDSKEALKNRESPSAKSLETGFKLWVITDVHYIAPSLHDDGKKFDFIVSTSAGKDLNYQTETLEALVMQAKKEQPDVLVVSGDLTLNGEKQSAIELADYFKEIEKNGTEVYVIPGNHDISDGWAKKYRGDQAEATEQILPKDFKSIFKKNGYQQAISSDPTSLSYLVAPRKNLWIMMIDSNKYSWSASKGAPVTSGSIREDTYQWMSENFQLAKEQGAKIIPVMHHNLMDHNQLVNRGFTIDKAENLQDFFAKEKVDFVLSGHIHAQDIASLDVKGHKIYDIVTGSFMMAPNPIGEFTYQDGSFTYQRQTTDVDGWAKETGATNLDLLQHSAYLAENMQKDGESFAIGQIYEEQWADKSQLDSVATFIGNANQRFFGGESYVAPENVKETQEQLAKNPAYQVLQQHPESSLTSYIDSIYIDQDTNNVQMEFPFN